MTDGMLETLAEYDWRKLGEHEKEEFFIYASLHQDDQAVLIRELVAEGVNVNARDFWRTALM